MPSWKFLTSLIAGLVLVVAPVLAPAATHGAALEPDGSAVFSTEHERGGARAAVEARVREVLQANPGSVRLSETDIQLEPGVVMTVPGATDGSVGTLGTPDCPLYFVCLYEHADFGGARIGFKHCRFFNLTRYQMTYFDDWAYEVSSWHNNQTGSEIAVFWDWRGDSFVAPVGADSYVGGHWNDWITGVDACLP